MDHPDRLRVAFLIPAEELTGFDISRSVSTLESCGFQVDFVGCPPREVDAAKYQAVALPAPVLADGSLRVNAEALELVRDMQGLGKPLICLPDLRVPGRHPSRVFSLKRLLADSWRNWNAIDAPRLGAALAYYTMLSLAPLVLLMVAITSLFFPQHVVQTGLVPPVRELMGNEVANLVSSVLQNAKATAGFIAGAASIIVLLLGASGVFLELRNSLNTVWGVKPPYGTGLWCLVRERVFAFLVIIGAGLTLLVFFTLATVLSLPTHLLMRFLPSEANAMRLPVILAAFAVMTIVFAFVYKVIPDISIRWGDVWIGALITSFLFTAGKLVISLYLGKASIGSAYAAAGSIIVFLTWVYYSAQIFLFGAAFTHVYALRHGSQSKTANHHRTSQSHD